MDSTLDMKRIIGVVVAHPDDEILWVGGTLLLHPEWRIHVFTLCRGHDHDRAGKFFQVMHRLHAVGVMTDLDDGPEQTPLPETLVEMTLETMLANTHYDCLYTHGPRGEYTRHRRHEEVNRAITSLWLCGRIHTEQICFFAFDDAGGNHLPHARPDAHQITHLPPTIREEKFRIIHEIYGFSSDSWEAKTTPKVEACWCFDAIPCLETWINRNEAV